MGAPDFLPAAELRARLDALQADGLPAPAVPPPLVEQQEPATYLAFEHSLDGRAWAAALGLAADEIRVFPDALDRPGWAMRQTTWIGEWHGWHVVICHVPESFQLPTPGEIQHRYLSRQAELGAVL